MDLAGAVVTADALHTVRANLDWLVSEKNAQYIAVVKGNQPLLHTSGWVKQAAVYPKLSEPWRETAVVLDDLTGAWWAGRSAEGGEPEAGS